MSACFLLSQCAEEVSLLDHVLNYYDCFDDQLTDARREMVESLRGNKEVISHMGMLFKGVVGTTSTRWESRRGAIRDPRRYCGTPNLCTNLQGKGQMVETQ